MSRYSIHPAGRFIICVAIVLSLFATPTRTRAHAVIIDSSPKQGAVLTRPPARVVLRFNSRIEKALSRVSISVNGGRQAPLKVLTDGTGAAAGPEVLVAPLPPLKPGAYAVLYKVMATDGHATAGILRFTVKGGP